tara:strand:+ start:1 stop:1521 length:1521 start_codon:yes stop_codon:yes gene_type:complete
MQQQMMQDQSQQTQFAEGGLVEKGGLMDYLSENAGGIASAGTGAMNMIGDLSGKGVSTNAATAGLTGAAEGAMAGAALGPLGMAGGAVLGGVTSLIGSGKAKREMLEKNRNETQGGRNQVLNTFANGGILNTDPKYPQDPNQLIKSFKSNKEGSNYANPYPNRSDRWNTFDAYQNDLKNRSLGGAASAPLNQGNKTPFGNGSGNAAPIADELKYNKKLLNRPVQPNNTVEYNSQINDNIVANNNFAKGGKITDTNQYGLGDWLKRNFTKGDDGEQSNVGKFVNTAMRYAPTAINAGQLANLPKAEVENLNKLDNRYKPGYVDEAALQNISRENFNMSNQALSGASGGSTSALRSNILGAGLNRNKALSNAYLKASDINRGEDSKAQQFNMGVDKVNLQQSNSEKDINARNRAARDNEKSKLLSGIGTDVGNIGKEEKYKDIIGKITGYGQDGKLTAAKKAKKEAAKKARITNRKTNRIMKTAKKSPINAIQRNDFNLYGGSKTYNV